MSPQALLLTIAAMGVGCLIACQAPVNAAMAARLGHPIAGATWSFIVGTIALLVLSAVFARGTVDPSAIPRLSPLLLLGGGLMGAVYVTSNILLTPRIGVGAVMALGIAGQMLASLLLDHFGMLGLAMREISGGRLAGALMVVGGALMIRYL